MSIECYDSKCKYHGCNHGEEGPFCYEDECLKIKEEEQEKNRGKNCFGEDYKCLK